MDPPGNQCFVTGHIIWTVESHAQRHGPRFRARQTFWSPTDHPSELVSWVDYSCGSFLKFVQATYAHTGDEQARNLSIFINHWPFSQGVLICSGKSRHGWCLASSCMYLVTFMRDMESGKQGPHCSQTHQLALRAIDQQIPHWSLMFRWELHKLAFLTNSNFVTSSSK